MINLPTESTITNSVINFLQRYPESNLDDIYKGFFQDEFGPGHLLTDPDGSLKYLLRELSTMTSNKRYTPEPCGIGKNFFRINLDIILDGFITAEEFFKIFKDGASFFQTPQINVWKEKWIAIEAAITPLKELIRDYDKNREALNQKIGSGDVVAHHSKIFVSRYDPHYRIIHRSVAEQHPIVIF